MQDTGFYNGNKEHEENYLISKYLTDKYYLLFLGVTTWLSSVQSQNRRIVEAGRDFWRSLVQSSSSNRAT